MATTTDNIRMLFGYHKYTESERMRAPRLRVADDTAHTPTGVGAIKLPARHGKHVYLSCYYTPEIPATIISPERLRQSLGCNAYHTISDFVGDTSCLSLIDCDTCDAPVTIELTRIRGLLFSDPIIAPTDPERDPDYRPPVTLDVQAIDCASSTCTCAPCSTTSEISQLT